MTHRLLLSAAAMVLTTAPALGREVITCQSWRHQPIDVTSDGRIPAFVPDRGWVSVRPRGIEGPQPDGPCSTEQFLARLAQTTIVLTLRNARLVAFCAPQDVGANDVEAAVLVDGVDLQRILVDTALAQPVDGTPRRDWCSR